MAKKKTRLTKRGKLVAGIAALLIFMAGINFGTKAVDGWYGDAAKDQVAQEQSNDVIMQNDIVAMQQSSDDVQQPDLLEPATENIEPEPSIDRQEPSGDWADSDLAQLDNTAAGWGFGNQLDENNRPKLALQAQANYGKYRADFIREDTPTIYLTLDEGYEYGYTESILNTLKEKNVQAVFFVTMSYAKNNEALVQRMIDEGHIIGNHSTTHPSAGLPSQDLTTQVGEITQLHAYMVDRFGYEMELFRFPAGIYSEQSLALVAQQGYRSVFWSYGYQDWMTDNQPDPEESLQKLTGRLHNGAVYLLHAVSATNTQILGQFIDDARAAGYTFGVYAQ